MFLKSIKMPSIVKKVKISRIVAASGLLTFLYLIEFCIGARTVYYAFYLWNNNSYGFLSKPKISWTLCVACLLVAVMSSFVVNFISARWEQKQIKEDGGEKNALRFAGHLASGGILWRYVLLWFSDNKDTQMRGALLLTMNKYLFTQFFTIPLVIVHASLLEHLGEIIYEACSVFCISVNLLLTCVMFSWCKPVVGDLRKWNYETIDLVPLIFSQSVVEAKMPDANDSEGAEPANKEPKTESDENPKSEDNKIELFLVRLLVWLQTFCFSFGRLLALGILLKLAGIYAISIMFLQLLVSVIYLKFQVPILVSDSLSKWRQLTRLVFMSYILIFEWHLNRDTNTGYDFGSNVKHSMLYYTVATLESVFYLVTWAITMSYTSRDLSLEMEALQSKFIRFIIVLGSMALVLSLALHFILLLWQSRRISIFVNSVKRRYTCSKLKMSLKRNTSKETNSQEVQRKQLDISHPIPICKNPVENQNEPELGKHNSYLNLREPLDEEIEIYCWKKDTVKDTDSVEITTKNSDKISVKMEGERKVPISISVRKKEEKLTTSRCTYNVDLGTPKKMAGEDILKETESSISGSSVANGSDGEAEHTSANTKVNEITDSTAPVKSKVAVFSDTFQNQWSKFSSASQKFTGTILEKIHNRKEQFMTSRANSIEKSKDKSKVKNKTVQEGLTGEDPPKLFIGEIYSSEGYFIGDERGQDEDVCYAIDQLRCKPDDLTSDGNNLSDKSESASIPDVEVSPIPESNESVHQDGVLSCPCFICRTGGASVLRRRSLSIMSSSHKDRIKSGLIAQEGCALPHYSSSPNILSGDLEGSDADKETVKRPPSPSVYPSSRHLTFVSADDRIEHYV